MLPPILTFPNFRHYRRRADAERLKRGAVAPILVALAATGDQPQPALPPTPIGSVQEAEPDDKVIDMKERAQRMLNSKPKT